MNTFLNIDQLLFANVHVGHTVKFFNSQLKGYLLGLRQQTFIFNLNLSILQYQIISNLITDLISKRHAILLVKEFNFIKIEENLKFYLSNFGKNIVFHEKKWFGGTLTNYKSVQYSSKFDNLVLKKLYGRKRFPSALCILDTNMNKWALFEGYNLGIPLISLINTDSIYPNLVDYPIASNNKAINSILLYFYILCNSIKLGRQKEVKRVLLLRELISDKKKVDNFIWKKFIFKRKKYLVLYKKDRLKFFRKEFIKNKRKNIEKIS